MRTVRIGVDVGGTFTDLVALDADTGEVVYHKSPSTPADPSNAIGVGVGELLTLGGIQAAAVRYLGHGTTVATNMVIEHRGARTGLITTRGFRDVLEIGRQTRPHLYDYRQRKPEPLATRAHRYEITERLDAVGDVLVPLAESELEPLIDAIKQAGLEAVAVVFLHAFRNPVHEQRVAERLRAALPAVYVSCSHEVLPEFREFERTSTTAVNAFVGPRMASYLDRLLGRVQTLGIEAPPHTVQSNGGLMSVDSARRLPVRTCLSGPAAGVVAAAAIGRAAGEPNLIAFDVGGTSTDVSLIVGGQPTTTSERLVAGHPVRSPMIDVHVIGAGGGSIARMDDAGGLKVGPQSAGAQPGPVAYGLGGTQVTLTDANVVLGRLNPKALLGGRMPIDAARASNSLQAQIAGPLNTSAEQAALGVISVAVANIARAIRSVSTDQGHDPAELTLLAYGGAGPVHAAAVAREVECSRVIVPVEPGTLCARGILLSDLRTDLVRTLAELATDAAWLRVRAQYQSLQDEAREWLAEEGVDETHSTCTATVEARYRGQSFEIPVEIDDPQVSTCEDFIARFHVVHQSLYGYAIEGRSVVIVNCRLRVVGHVAKAPLHVADRPTAIAADVVAAARTGTREVFLNSVLGWRATPVYQRDKLPIGASVQGPAIVEEMSSTTYIGPSDFLDVDGLGNLVVTVGADDAS